jgi:SAM-dependent methyltransferase
MAMSLPATSTNPSAAPSEVDRWNGDYGRQWADNADQHDAFLAPVADALLAAAVPAAGEIVVDIGCGCGATTLLAAAQVGEAGAAVGVDVSEAMLEVARQRAELAGPGAPTFIHADVETYSFERGAADLVISRFGTMSFPDPARAFGNIAITLKPSGRLCIATWQPLMSNEWLLVPGAALLEHTGPLATPEGPGPFAQSDPDVITSTLAAAGFVDLMIEGVQLQLDCGPTADAALEFFAQSGSGRRVLGSIPAGPQREAARADVRNAFAERCDPNGGVRLGGAIWLVTAQRGPS